MSYTARQLIDRARSYAAIQNTQFISYSDEVALLNEAYRDLYSRYTESDGDYWSIERIITPTPADIDPNNPNAYLITLPTDFLKIRALSYSNGNSWAPVQRFSMADRDDNPSRPRYRLKNSTLWVIGGIPFAQLKLDYYPIQPVITAPDVDIPLALQEQVYTYQTISSHYYDDTLQAFFYVIGNTIKIEDLRTNTTVSVYTGTNPIDSIVYKAGYVYWRDTVTKNIYRCVTDLVTTLVPVSIKASVENFSIQGNYIYYSTATDTRRCGLAGGADVQLQVYASLDYLLLGANYLYISGGVVYLNAVSTAINATAIATDGTYIFLQNPTGSLDRYNIAAGVLTFVDNIGANVQSIGNALSDNYLSIVTPESVTAQSMVLDYVFDYPSNEVNEILAYICAIAYVRKQGDQTMMGLLTARLTELWDLFWSVNKRDEYQFQRINNDYKMTGIGGW